MSSSARTRVMFADTAAGGEGSGIATPQIHFFSAWLALSSAQWPHRRGIPGLYSCLNVGNGSKWDDPKLILGCICCMSICIRYLYIYGGYFVELRRIVPIVWLPLPFHFLTALAVWCSGFNGGWVHLVWCTSPLMNVCADLSGWLLWLRRLNGKRKASK